ncbi:MAG: hypothetical protein UHN47_06915 [Lachnospiraceae bacterium]|nr:hypothetical protein [Lachnospiraceae bacterium]
MKHKYKTIRTNIIMIIFTLIIAVTYTISVNATTGLTGKKSVGKIVFAGDTSDQDVIFDSSDFNKLADVCR